MCLTCEVDGQSLSQYRTFGSGNDVPRLLALAASIRLRRIRSISGPRNCRNSSGDRRDGSVGPVSSSVDLVEQIRSNFYNDQLFRVVVAYEHERRKA